MKWINAISLCLLISMPVLVKMSILGNYWINQHYYTKVLCVKKNIPESTCNGKCVLSMQLKDVGGSDPANAFPPNRLLQFEMPLFLAYSPELAVKLFAIPPARHALFDEDAPDSRYQPSVFRPPSQLV
jgi:hypothetical protein